MPEKLLYSNSGSGSGFAGSIDDDGIIYDEKHRYLGRIIGNKVYDNCNKERATIDSNGDIWDINHNYVGKESGENFLGPLRQFRGFERGQVHGHSQGRSYGAVQVLNNFENATLSNPPVTNYNKFGEPESEKPKKESFGYERFFSERDDSYLYDAPPPPPRRTPAPRSKPRNYGYGGESRKSPIDVSRMGTFWGCVMSFFAGLTGREVITRWDRINRRHRH